jgi:hypothetical protein
VCSRLWRPVCPGMALVEMAGLVCSPGVEADDN